MTPVRLPAAMLLGALLVAACAGAAAPVAATSTSPGTDAGARAVTPAGPSVVPNARIAMKAPVTTVLGGDLEAIGLDPKHLPVLAKLAPEQLRKVMPLFAKSLGVKCTACHVWNTEGTPPKTPRMKVAEQMWNQFVRRLSLADGSPLFCDSCHQGSIQVLDRHDLAALSTWMKESFVGKLARTDAPTHDGEHGCSTCHGDPMRPRFIASWKGEMLTP